MLLVLLEKQSIGEAQDPYRTFHVPKECFVNPEQIISIESSHSAAGENFSMIDFTNGEREYFYGTAKDIALAILRAK